MQIEDSVLKELVSRWRARAEFSSSDADLCADELEEVISHADR